MYVGMVLQKSEDFINDVIASTNSSVFPSSSSYAALLTTKGHNGQGSNSKYGLVQFHHHLQQQAEPHRQGGHYRRLFEICFPDRFKF